MKSKTRIYLEENFYTLVLVYLALETILYLASLAIEAIRYNIAVTLNLPFFWIYLAINMTVSSIFYTIGAVTIAYISSNPRRKTVTFSCIGTGACI